MRRTEQNGQDRAEETLGYHADLQDRSPGPPRPLRCFSLRAGIHTQCHITLKVPSMPGGSIVRAFLPPAAACSTRFRNGTWNHRFMRVRTEGDLLHEVCA